MQTQTTQPLPRYSQYTVRLMAPRVSSYVTYFRQPPNLPTAPPRNRKCTNVIRLLSAETECPPKVPIYPHSAPKPKLKPKFGRPLASIMPNFASQSNEHGWCVGDSGYPAEPWLLTRLANPTTPAETAYNSAHARTRNVIERCF